MPRTVSEEEESADAAPFLAVRQKAMPCFARTVVPNKGECDYAKQFLVDLLDDWGMNSVALRSDQEPLSLRSRSP